MLLYIVIQHLTIYFAGDEGGEREEDVRTTAHAFQVSNIYYYIRAYLPLCRGAAHQMASSSSCLLLS